MEHKQSLLAAGEQQNREQLIAKTHEVVGQIRSAGMISKFANVSSLVWLKQVKESKIYKDLPNLGTWDKFCDYVGISRQKVDLDLQNLATFGEEFLLTVGDLNVGYRELRKLRQLAQEGEVAIEAEFVTIGQEKIPLTPDHTEDLQAAIEAVLESKNKVIEEATATIRAKDRLLETKEKLIHRQEKALARLEGQAEKKGLSAEEDAFIKQCVASRITIDGFLTQFDTEINPLPDDATPRMRAALMETLGYFRRVIDAAFSTASELYGEPELDDEWVPPHLRPAEGGARICSGCEWHKALSNPKKGIKIPGQTGKCTRPEGLCAPDPTPASEG